MLIQVIFLNNGLYFVSDAGGWHVFYPSTILLEAVLDSFASKLASEPCTILLTV